MKFITFIRLVFIGFLSFFSSMSFAYSISIKNNTNNLYSYIYGSPVFGELNEADRSFIHPGETALINIEFILPSPSNLITIYQEKSGYFERKKYEYSVRVFEYPSYDFVSFQLDSNLFFMKSPNSYSNSAELSFDGDYNSSKLYLKIDSISTLNSDVLRYEFYTLGGNIMGSAKGEIFSGVMDKR
ncbi:TPA: hypothetical protein F3L22_12565 [Aeromonas hydrophila]|nr:hypothetical protein [Aeromonas hydrophila]